MAQEPEQDDVVVMGWLRGDDYEAALAYRRRDRATEKDEPSAAANSPTKHPSITSRLVRRGLRD
jgi:hypothetical protein